MSMEYSRSANELTICLKGRMTAENVPQIETEFLSLLRDGRPEKVLLDAKDLAYISSSGLRVLLKIKKSCSDFSIINVSRDVADILQMTGLDEMLDIKRALREISVDGCPCIGRGRNGAVYRLDRDTIVKLYPADSLGWQSVEQEKKNAKTAFVLGVPTALSYDVVRVGDKIGIVFELVDARSLRDVVATEPERIESLVTKSAALLRRLHHIEVPAGAFPQMAEVYRQRAADLEDWLTQGEIGLLFRMIDSIPTRSTYVHGDYHRGNLMVQGDEIVIIDMADSSTGHPLYDVLGVYMLGKNIADTMPPEVVKRLIGWDADTVRRVWDVFARTYFQPQDARDLAQIEEMLEVHCWLRQLTFLKIATVLTDEDHRRIVQSAREQFFPRVEERMGQFAELMARM